jgi:hypothetical protein
VFWLIDKTFCASDKAFCAPDKVFWLAKILFHAIAVSGSQAVASNSSGSVQILPTLA